MFVPCGKIPNHLRNAKFSPRMASVQAVEAGSSDTKHSQSTASSRPTPMDAQLEKLVTDEQIVRASTPAPANNGQKSSQPPSPSGSPPLTSKVSLPQLNQSRSPAQEGGRPPESERPKYVTTAPRHGTGKGAQRSQSVSNSNMVRSTTWTETGSTTSKLPPPRRVREGTRSGSSALDEPPRSRSKGIVAFLKSGKSRGKSPASTKKYPDGVMGKEGARVWVKDAS